MSIPKYILFTVHLTVNAGADRFIAIKAETLDEAVEAACRYINTESLFIVRIYERVPITSTKNFRYVARVRADGSFEQKIVDSFTDIDEMGAVLYEE